MRRRNWFFLGLAAVATFLPSLSFAQSTANQINPGNATGVLPYNTYGGARENINLATGNLNLQVPLLTLRGRNGHDLVLGVNYDSKVWTLNYFYDPDTATQSYSWEYEEREPGVTAGYLGHMGWRLNLPVLESTGGSETIGPHPTTCSFGGFIVTLGDGSKHRFTNKENCRNYLGQLVEGSHVSDSVDGAFLRLETTSTQAFLHLPDGTDVRFASLGGGIPDRITDADGNLITIQTTAGKLSQITDTVGRIVSFTWSADGSLQSISYKDSGGTARLISFSHSDVSINATFTLPAGSVGWSFTTKLLSTVTLPNQLTYVFDYNGYGELTKIKYPTGGYTRYDYIPRTHWWQDMNFPAIQNGSTAADFREVSARHVCREASGSCATEDTTTYIPPPGGVDGTKSNNELIDVRDAEGNRTRYRFSYAPQGSTGYFFSPRELTREVYQGESTLLRTIQIDYNGLDANGRTQNWSLPIRVTTTLNDVNPAKVTKTEWDYDTYTALSCGVVPGCTPQPSTQSIDNVTEQREYDYGDGAVGALVRKTVNTWLKVNPINNQNYFSTAIWNVHLKASEKVYDAAGTVAGQTDFEYDKYSAPNEPLVASGAVQHNTNYGTTHTTRGNLTAVKRWRNTDGAWLETRHLLYDDAGNLRKTRDPLLHVTEFFYDDSWANSACAPTTGKAYLTKIKDALLHETTSTYNSCSGTAATTTDPNLRTTNFTVYDEMGRLRQTDLPANGQVLTSYAEAAMPLSVTRTVKITGTMNAVAPTDVDGLGRVIQTRLTSDPQGTVRTDVTYDALGRKKTVSTPYRSTSDPTYGITTFEYDALGRVTKVIPPDGSGTANNITTTYSGNCATVTDQAGKKRKSCTDALGRLVQVFEPGAGGSFIYETAYQYDLLNNLTRVDQKGNDPNSANWRTRTFTYNSLSQLLSASNPESGTITYTYDNDGNLLTKTSPKPNQTNPAVTVTITYAYDALHRLISKTYSDTTPAVSYTYDETTTCFDLQRNGVGRRTSMTDGAGTETWCYDEMGRVRADRRVTNGVTKDFKYTYNLDGSLATLIYPSGRVVTYAYNAAGRALSAMDGSTNYVLNAAYAPQGALASLQNGANVVSTYFYNNRLQPCRISVKSSGTAPTDCGDALNTGNMLDFTYNFDSDAAPGVQNNGNVGSVANNRNHNRDQSFTYDELNRVKTAQSAATAGADCWGLSFAYDIWANLLTQTVTKCSAPALNVAVSNQNRISSAGFTYDAAGNMTQNGTASYTYDAENRLLTAGGVTYTYDGDGRRVKKSNGKLYWYGAGSEVLLETDLAGGTQDEYVFFNGKRVARRRQSDGAVFYFFADHLGSSRVVTNATGGIVEESDFYPFGGERTIVDSLDNNYKFTGHERDAESGLDNMKARHFASSLGRFPQPDSFAFSSLTNPQSLNLYAYVLNNPLYYSDPTGHEPSSGCGNWSPCGMTGGGPLPARMNWGIFGSPADWDGIYWWQADEFSAVKNDMPPPPPYNQISPVAQQVLQNTYGVAGAQEMYNSWTLEEQATFLNNIAAAVDAHYDLSQAFWGGFRYKHGSPYGIKLIGVTGNPNMDQFADGSFRSPSNIMVGSLEATNLGCGNGCITGFDVDLFNPNNMLTIAPHGLFEVFWHWATRSATDPWQAAAALLSRRVCSGVVPC